MQQFVNFVRHFLIRNCAALLWFPLDLCGKCWDMDCGTFCQTGRNSANVLHFHGKSHQSVAHLMGEKRHTCRHVFKCRCGTLVAIFLTRTTCYIYIHTFDPSLHIGKYQFAPPRHICYIQPGTPILVELLATILIWQFSNCPCEASK